MSQVESMRADTWDNCKVEGTCTNIHTLYIHNISTMSPGIIHVDRPLSGHLCPRE